MMLKVWNKILWTELPVHFKNGTVFSSKQAFWAHGERNHGFMIFLPLFYYPRTQSVNSGIFDKEDVKFHEIFILCAKTCI